MSLQRDRDADVGSLAAVKAALEQRTRELAEAHDREAATAEVLKAISSTSDLQRVLDTLLETACRLCEADIGTIRYEEGEGYRLAATFGCRPEWREHFAGYSTKPDRTSVFGKTILDGSTVHIPDVLDDPEYARPVAQKLMGLRAALGVPLMRAGKTFGVISLFRTMPRPFTAKQIALLETFADQAEIAIENARLMSEQREALDRQTATSEVLGVISSSPGEIEPVFAKILENAARICEAKFTNLFLYSESENAFRLAANKNAPATYVERWAKNPVLALDENPRNPLARLAKTKRLVDIFDLKSEPGYADRDPRFVALVEAAGARTHILIPMLKEGALVGAIAVYRQEVRAFSEKQIELLTNFAAQAVIAIENARLLNELRETLDRQTATSEILKVIASSPTNAQPVFDAIAHSAMRLFGGQSATVTRVVGDEIHLAALTGGNEAGVKSVQSSFPTPLSSPGVHSRVARNGQPAFRSDIESDPDVSSGIKETARARGYRSILVVPMLRDGIAIGTIGVTRPEPTRFTDDQIDLLKTFADQAVIAIENARLFAAEQQRTKELGEALEQQTATSEVLEVISSSPGELEPVFQAMLKNATRICEAHIGILFRYEDGAYTAVSFLGVSPAYADYLNSGPIRAGDGTGLGRVARTLQTVEVADTKAEQAYVERDPFRVATADIGGARSLLNVPMLKDGRLVGAISVYRQEVRPFTGKQIELVSNFAAQAVIAIENARLLSELRESLEQQTATSEVLRVISSSPGDLGPVFSAMLENATRICEAKFGTLLLSEGDGLRAVALHGALPAYAEERKRQPVFRPAPTVPVARAIRTKQVQHVTDLRAEQAYVERDQAIVTMVEAAGARTFLAVPMLKDDEAIGAIIIYRLEVRPFSDKQIELVENFAAQAVIAIENARLLNELRESLAQQTATADVLRIIASSTGELAPVFGALLANATRLCEASYGALWLCEGDAFRTAALHGDLPQAYLDQWRSGTLFRPSPDVPMARVAASGQPVQVADLRTTQAYRSGDHLAVTGVDDGGIRTVATVPMFKDKELLGVIAIYRTEVKPFADKQIELVQNFAAQAVIAIENARLLSELRETLERQTATSEVLKVISSSPGELEPVFSAMLENAVRICGAKMGTLFLSEGKNSARAVAQFGTPPEYAEDIKRRPVIELGEGALGRCARTKQPVQIADVLVDPAYLNDPPRLAIMKLNGARTIINVPMLKDEEVIGQIAIYRQEIQPFTDKQIALLTNFAAQAVIAIENARLLSELRESLDQQTATSEVLKVIASSTGELQPVFSAMLANAARLCEASYGAMWLCQGNLWRAAAMHGDLPPAYLDLWRSGPWFDPGVNAPMPRAAASRAPVHIPDMREDISYRGGGALPVSAVEVAGVRTLLCVPMLRESEIIGVITIYRTEVRPFAEKQVDLVKNFGAQAVIAIENARLLSELRQRTDDLTESLQQQTATSDILEVISNSPTDSQPAFDAIVRSGLKLFPDAAVMIALPDGDMVTGAAIADADPANVEALRQRLPLRLSREFMTSAAILDRQEIDIPDASDAPQELQAGAKNFLASGYRALTAMPMMRGDQAIGALSVMRRHAGPLSDKQKALLRTFASQAVIAIENTRLFNELRQRTDDLTESLEQQQASGEILSSISGSMADTQPVFDAIVRNLLRLFGTRFAVVQVLRDGIIHMPAVAGDGIQKLIDHYPRPLDYNTIGGLSMLGKKVMQFATIVGNPDVPVTTQQFAREFGFDSAVFAPMVRDDRVIGAIGIAHHEPKKYSDKQIALIKAFADQAVIAVENTRLFNELRERTDDLSEALQQQTATADVLAVMSRSQFDLAPILQSVVDTAARLCRAEKAVIFRLEDGLYRFAAGYSLDPKYIEIEKATLIAPGPGTAVGRAAMNKQVVRIDDAFSDPHYAAKDDAKIGDVRSMIGVPLMREGEPIGVIALARSRVEPFNEREIDLVTTFADQAVIAIENVRLFDEVKARTDDLSESLQQQTATADVLKVISRATFDLQTVLDTLVESAARLCEADYAWLFQREGEFFYWAAGFGYSTEEYMRISDYFKTREVRAERGSIVGRCAIEGKVIHVTDVLADPDYTWQGAQAIGGYRAALGAPLLREGNVVGVIFLSKKVPQPFTTKQIDLVSTFADQAVIAIENVRLFDEVQARTEDLSESLQQQTATADVLKVISRSTFDLKTVLDTLLNSAARLCEADQGTITQKKGDQFFRSVAHGYPPEFMEYVKDLPVELKRDTGTGRALIERKIIHIPDVESDPEYTWKTAQKLGGFRTMLGVPMVREGEPVGVLTLTRKQVRPFTQKEIDLVATFADQAAIAIENVRLFDEIQDKSRQLEEASKHKSQFLANMSHELRTPLNAILGYTELIADGVYGETPEKVQATIKRVMTNGRHLLGLINDVLDLSKIEAGQLSLSLTDYSMKDVVHNVYGAVEPLASEKKLGFKVEIAPDMAIGHGDERRLTQVLLNLVGNAIKFTDEGEVVIKASQNNGAFSVAVCDTGPGISEDDQKKLFQEFQQADSSTTKKKGGTGLGLAISKKIIEMHGGRIWLESQVGKGSTFAFTVPTRAEQAKRQA